MDDRFRAEVWDASEYEPDLSGVRRRVLGSALSDRENAAIHYALEEFNGRMAEYEIAIGRELLAVEKIAHINRFKRSLARTYGAGTPDAGWLARHDGWCSRHGGA